MTAGRQRMTQGKNEGEKSRQLEERDRTMKRKIDGWWDGCELMDVRE